MMNLKPDFELAPIVLFVYNRVDTLELTINALKHNVWAEQSVLYVFSDFYKSDRDKDAVLQVREFIRKISGFKEIFIIEAAENLGLAKSIINGVTLVISQHQKAIVLEDDLISSRNFLVYMNKALVYYEQESKIFSIAGYSPTMTDRKNNDVYLTRRASSWGWATWADRWQEIDWEVQDYPAFRADKVKRKQFNEMGSDLCGMLDKQMMGKLNSWAIRWVYAQFIKDLYSVYPRVSKIENVGTAQAATNTRDSANRFKTVLDKSDRLSFDFIPADQIDPELLKHFIKQYSIRTRIKYKILNAFAYWRSLMMPKS